MQVYLCSIYSTYAIIDSRMMSQQKAHGFTVIEVMIFLSISGLLIIIAFMGTGSSLARAQFKDGMSTIQSFVQQQYSDVQNGLNLRTNIVGSPECGPSNPIPGTGKCLFLGKLITFDPANGNQIVVYPVVSSTAPSSNDSMSESQMLDAYNPIVAKSTGPPHGPNDLREYFDLPWQIKSIRSCDRSKLDTITADKMLGDCDVAGGSFDSYLILRSPQSGAINTYIFDGGWDLDNGSSLKLDPTKPLGNPNRGYMGFTSLSNYRNTGNICFESQGLIKTYGGIQVGGRVSSGQTGNTLTFDMDEATMEAVCGV